MPIRSTVPFSIDRNDARPLVRQIVDGVREAVSSGRYVPGDVVPPYVRLAQMLGVSRIVTLEALKRLSAEGIVEARPRRGTFIRDTALKQWRGHVVMVVPDSDQNYLQTILAGALRNRLIANGCLFTQICVPVEDDGTYDFSFLDAALARSVDLAITIFNACEIFRHLAQRSVPFAVLREIAGVPEGAIGATCIDHSHAAGEFAACCAAAGIQKVVEVCWNGHICSVARSCRAKGIEVETVSVSVEKTSGCLLRIKRAGYEIFRKLVAARRLRSSRRSGVEYADQLVAYFIADDYLAAGAFLAVAEAGLRVPQDIRIATWANAGLGPFFSKDPSRIELDPAEAGETLAGAALKFLKTGSYPADTTIEPRWIRGKTLS